MDAKAILAALAIGVIGGATMYASQFLTAGPSPESIQVMQVQRELLSTAILVLAAAVGYGLFDGDSLRKSAALIGVVFLVSGLVGYGLGFVALWLVPPEGFTLGSRALTFTLVVLQEVVPFTLAGFAGVALRTAAD